MTKEGNTYTVRLAIAPLLTVSNDVALSSPSASLSFSFFHRRIACLRCARCVRSRSLTVPQAECVSAAEAGVHYNLWAELARCVARIGLILCGGLGPAGDILKSPQGVHDPSA